MGKQVDSLQSKDNEKIEVYVPGLTERVEALEKKIAELALRSAKGGKSPPRAKKSRP
jgi:hypothetical protein